MDYKKFVESFSRVACVLSVDLRENDSDNCAINDRPIHTYFDIELYNAWMEVFLTHLASDDPDTKMILFSYEMNPKADIDKLTDISSETAANVIKAMQTADARMYEIKAEYYTRHPEMDWHNNPV